MTITSKLSVVFVLISLLLVANDNTVVFASQDLSDSEIEKINEEFCSLGDREIFYLAEQKVLLNIDDSRIVELLSEVSANNPEPLVRKRADRILELQKNENFSKVKKQKYFGLYFSSDFKRRLNAVYEMWLQNTPEAENYLFYFVENDDSYDVKTKAILALTDFEISQDKASSFIILCESSDEDLAVSSLYVLVNNNSPQAQKILSRWLTESKYDWHKKQALRILEASPEMISLVKVIPLFLSEQNHEFFDNYCEIIAKKLSESDDLIINKLLNSLRMLINRNQLHNSQSWITLWQVIVSRHDLRAFFKGTENKRAIPKIVWCEIALLDLDSMMKLAFSGDKYIRNLARYAIAQAGFGIELMKRIEVCKLKNTEELTLNEIIKHIRLNCHFEIYLSSYSQQIRDSKIQAYFGKCTLYELLAILSTHLDLRYEFDNGRLLVYPGYLIYRGFNVDPIYMRSSTVQDFFNSYVTKGKIKSQTIHEFNKYMRDLTDITFIAHTSKDVGNINTPEIDKDRGLIPVLTRAINEENLDIFIMANALWIIDKDDDTLYEDARSCIKKPSKAYFQKLVESTNPKKFQIISSLLQSSPGTKLEESSYQSIVYELVKSAKGKYEISALIPCFSRLIRNNEVVDKLIDYTQSPAFEIRNAAINTLKNSNVDSKYLLSKFINLKLNAQKIAIELISNKLKIQDIEDYFVSLIETGKINDLKLNFRIWSNLVMSIFLVNNKPNSIDNRLNFKIENADLNWLLHLLRLKTQVNIQLSPFFTKKLSNRPGLLKTPLNLNSEVNNLITALNILFFQLSASAEVKELMPIPKVYEIGLSDKEREIAIAYPFEFERLIMFMTILRASTKIKSGFEKEVFEYIWSITDIDELITTCNTKNTGLQTVKEYTNNINVLIEKFEKDRIGISPEFARLFMRLRKMLNIDIPEMYDNYKDFPEDWFLPDSLKLKPGESDE